jgi:hypothetical protein
MIYKDRTYRNTEEISTSEQTLEGRLAALDNFGGGGSATAEIREELKLSTPEPVVEKPAKVETTDSINSGLGETAVEATEVETPAAEAPEVTEATTEQVTIESDMFEGGALNLGTKPKDNTEYSEDVSKFISDFGYGSADELKAKLEESDSNSKKIEDLSSKIASNDELFKKMPADMYNAVVAWANQDGDWKDKINNDSVDYLGDISSHSTKDLVDVFHPGAFNEDDWEEYNDEDGDVNIKKAIDIAYRDSSNKFESKKNEIVNYQSGISEKQAERMQMFDSSVGSTIGNLSTQMSGLSESYVKSIESKIRNNEIMSLFYDENGSLKPDAAHRLILAQDGNDLIEKYSKLYKTQANNEATQDILDRSSDTPNKTQGGSSTAKTDSKSALQQGIDNLNERFNKKHTF